MIRLLMANDWHRHWNFILHVTVSGAFVANIWIWNTSVDFLIDVLVSDLRLLMGQGTAGVIILFIHNEPSDSHSDIFWEFLLLTYFTHITLSSSTLWRFATNHIKSSRKTKRLKRTDQHFFTLNNSFPSAHTKARIFFFYFFSNVVSVLAA